MTSSFFRRWFPRREVSPVSNSHPRTSSEEAEAQFQTGLQLACWRGGEPDYKQAAQCYGRAAELGHTLAQFNLALMYEKGHGMRRDEVKSLMWLTRAAQQGDAGAQYKLGLQQFVTGRGNEQTKAASEGRIEALKWVRLSAVQGYRGAENACEFVVSDMTTEEVAEGGRRVDAFQIVQKAE